MSQHPRYATCHGTKNVMRMKTRPIDRTVYRPIRCFSGLDVGLHIMLASSLISRTSHFTDLLSTLAIFPIGHMRVTSNHQLTYTKPPASTINSADMSANTGSPRVPR